MNDEGKGEGVRRGELASRQLYSVLRGGRVALVVRQKTSSQDEVEGNKCIHPVQGSYISLRSTRQRCVIHVLSILVSQKYRLGTDDAVEGSGGGGGELWRIVEEESGVEA